MSPFWSVSLFWIASVLFVVVALALILPPLLRKYPDSGRQGRRDFNVAVYRDQMKELEEDRACGQLAEEQFQPARQELEARLAEDALGQQAPVTTSGGRFLAYVLGVLLPVAAFGLYFWLGSPGALMTPATGTAAAQANGQVGGQPGAQPGGHDMAKLAEQLEAKVQTSPGDGKAWTMLGRIYAALQRWPDAGRAFQEAIRLLPQDASVHSAYAEALAIQHQRNLTGEPMQQVRQALALDPADPKGLELAGIAAFQEKDYKSAIAYLTRLYRQLSPDDPNAKDIQTAIQEAEKASGAKPALDNLSEPAQAGAGAGASISGNLEVAAALKGKLSPQDTVFVFAGNGGPPLAAMRLQASQLPTVFELTDAMAMMPDNKLSTAKMVTLSVRVAKSGQPMGASGDLEGRLENVRVGAKNVHLIIDKIRP